MASNPAIPAIDIEQEASENTSLLRDSEADNIELLCKKPSTLVIIAILLIYFLLLNFSDEIIVPAQMRVFESIYCKIYYEKHDPSLIGSDGGNGVAEKWCKGSVIQGEVAMLKGWQVTLDSIGSKLGLFFYGRDSRRNVKSLCLANKFTFSASIFLAMGLLRRHLWTQTGATTSKQCDMDQMVIYPANLLLCCSTQINMDFCHVFNYGWGSKYYRRHGIYNSI